MALPFSITFNSFPVPFELNSQDWNSRLSILWLQSVSSDFHPITSSHILFLISCTTRRPLKWSDTFPASMPLFLQEGTTCLLFPLMYFYFIRSLLVEILLISQGMVYWHWGWEFVQQFTEKSSNTILFIKNLLRLSQSDEISFLAFCTLFYTS